MRRRWADADAGRRKFVNPEKIYYTVDVQKLRSFYVLLASKTVVNKRRDITLAAPLPLAHRGSAGEHF